MQHDDLDREKAICDAAPSEDDRSRAAYWLAGAERLSHLEPPFRAKNIAICLASAFRKGANYHAEECRKLRDAIEEGLWKEREAAMLDLIKRLADDVELEVNARYQDDQGNIHPAMQRRYERDMANVKEARALEGKR